MLKMKKPELLSPAGDWEKLQMAVLYGADAVYLAGKSFGMRSAPSNFTNEELEEAVKRGNMNERIAVEMVLLSIANREYHA